MVQRGRCRRGRGRAMDLTITNTSRGGRRGRGRRGRGIVDPAFFLSNNVQRGRGGRGGGIVQQGRGDNGQELNFHVQSLETCLAHYREIDEVYTCSWIFSRQEEESIQEDNLCVNVLVTCSDNDECIIFLEFREHANREYGGDYFLGVNITMPMGIVPHANVVIQAMNNIANLTTDELCILYVNNTANEFDYENGLARIMCLNVLSLLTPGSVDLSDLDRLYFRTIESYPPCVL